MSEKLYFIQDARQFVGNAVLFWCSDRCGYTTDIDKAGRYPETEANKIAGMRKTDIAWPVEILEPCAKRYVDAQDLERLKRTGFEGKK